MMKLRRLRLNNIRKAPRSVHLNGTTAESFESVRRGPVQKGQGNKEVVQGPRVKD